VQGGALTPASMKVSPDGGLVFLSIQDGIAVVDVLTQEVSHIINHASFSPEHLEINPTGTLLFVAPAYGPGFVEGVAVYDVASGQQVRHLALPKLANPMAMTITPDGKTLAIDWIGIDPVTQRNGPIHLTVMNVETGESETESPGVSDEGMTVGSVVAVAGRDSE
jgi:DNA-binding beta-propeller fold protein YncE